MGLYAEYYIENGRVVTYANSEAIASIDRNRELLGLDVRQRGNKRLLETYYGPTSFSEALTSVFNPDDAVVDWQPCIRQHQAAAKHMSHQTGGLVREQRIHAL